MSQLQAEQKTYQMPPKDGITVAHFITVADIERSLRQRTSTAKRAATSAVPTAIL